MVRVLSCHHFKGQRIGRCDEATAIAVAKDYVVIGHDHQIHVYHGVPVNISGQGHPPPSGRKASPGPAPVQIPNISPASPHLPALTSKFSHVLSRTASGIFSHGSEPPAFTEIGAHVHHFPVGASKPSDDGKKRRSSGPSNADQSESYEAELKLSHSFATIDLIDVLKYNKKGEYLLCLERRESSSTNCVRIYFHWDRKPTGGERQMRARIAGLVSPSVTEHEEDSLTMVEIPMTSPPTAVASCELTGHIACLSAESVINLFQFRIKEGAGRSKVHYPDFDRVYSLEMPGFVPTKISFLGNYVACLNAQHVQVVRVLKQSNHPSSTEKTKEDKDKHSVTTHNQPNKDNDAVYFDPKNEGIKVYLASIIKGNRRRKAPSAGFIEEFNEDIKSRNTKLIYSSSMPGALEIDDLLRISVNHPQQQNGFIQLHMYPIRTKDTLGGISCVIGTSKEAILYFLPTVKNSFVTRVVSYFFTAPLISFAFDSLCFHALTETGLETYTFRGLWHAIRDKEGISKFHNDCPFADEPPSLVGIRPFIGVRQMVANEKFVCLLASPSSNHPPAKYVSPPISPQSPATVPPVPVNDDSLWTLYSLELPDIATLLNDTKKAARINRDVNAENYFTLLCEGHLWLRLFINKNPEWEQVYLADFKELCRKIGLEHLKNSWIDPADTDSITGSETDTLLPYATTSYTTLPIDSASSKSKWSFDSSCGVFMADVVDTGVTFLRLGDFTLASVFTPEYEPYLKDGRYVHGFVRLIHTFLPELATSISESHGRDSNKLPPSLVSVLVEFLATHSPGLLVEYVIEIPLMREHNSAKLISILKRMAESRQFEGRETLALLLTLVGVNGLDANCQNEVKTIVSHASGNLESVFELSQIATKKGGHLTLTELGVVLISAKSPIPVNIIFAALKSGSLGIAEVMHSFAQSVNLNSDPGIQHCLTHAFSAVLEKYLALKLILMTLAEMDDHEKLKVKPVMEMAGAKDLSTKKPVITVDEKRAVATLVRSYVSGLNFTLHHRIQTGQRNSVSSDDGKSKNSGGSGKTSEEVDNALNEKLTNTESTDTSIDPVTKNQVFGKIPSFVNYLLSSEATDKVIIPNLGTCDLFPTEESRENYIKLVSLLASPLGSVEGIHDIVMNYVQKTLTIANNTFAPLLLILQVLSDPAEKAVKTMLAKHPVTVVLFAKETFGKTASKWKILVAELKKKINAAASNEQEKDKFLAIIESVYLHLANSLTPSELEVILDKGDDSTKFHETCKRVDLANHYSGIVVNLSKQYLQEKRNA